MRGVSLQCECQEATGIDFILIGNESAVIQGIFASPSPFRRRSIDGESETGRTGSLHVATRVRAERDGRRDRVGVGWCLVGKEERETDECGTGAEMGLVGVGAAPSMCLPVA